MGDDRKANFRVDDAKRIGKATLWTERQMKSEQGATAPTPVPDLTPYFAVINSSTPRVDGGSTIAGCFYYTIEERIPDLDGSGYKTWRTPANPKSSSEAVTIKEPVLVGMSAALANGSYILVVPRYGKDGKLVHEFIPAPEGRLEVMNGSSVDQGVMTIAFGTGLVVTSNSSTKVTVTAGLHLYHDVCGETITETDDGIHSTLKLKSECCVGNIRWSVSGDNISASTWTLNVNDISPATKLNFTSGDGSHNVVFTVSSSSGTSCDGKVITIQGNVSLGVCDLNNVLCSMTPVYVGARHDYAIAHVNSPGDPNHGKWELIKQDEISINSTRWNPTTKEIETQHITLNGFFKATVADWATLGDYEDCDEEEGE